MQAACHDSPEPPSSPPFSPTPTPLSSPPPTPPLSSTLRQIHPLLISLPPPAPSHSVWQCCSCRQVYRFSAVRNRCLLCSHRFCKQCPDEHDNDGWDSYIRFWSSITPSSIKPSGFCEEEEAEWENEALFWEPLQHIVAGGENDEEESSTSSETPEPPIEEEREETGWTSDWLFERDDAADIGMQVKLAPYTLQRRYSHPYTEQYPRSTTPFKILIDRGNISPLDTDNVDVGKEGVQNDVADEVMTPTFEELS
ncbi:hypothetical protein L873DRAFT_1788834 [Choiromyces venosus 120613-1]|uniref:Uncharacterized protein n=1 Tax=Choiromyces venosus 120613-1 TaxID=1336337 RepID=A0A3N4JQQ4_9PEZI|nr:hypothetical protein L873DRAFT_1788834 [Choiromyces venosus 120613-1]